MDDESFHVSAVGARVCFSPLTDVLADSPNMPASLFALQKIPDIRLKKLIAAS